MRRLGVALILTLAACGGSASRDDTQNRSAETAPTPTESVVSPPSTVASPEQRSVDTVAAPTSIAGALYNRDEELWSVIYAVHLPAVEALYSLEVDELLVQPAFYCQLRLDHERDFVHLLGYAEWSAAIQPYVDDVVTATEDVIALTEICVADQRDQAEIESQGLVARGLRDAAIEDLKTAIPLVGS